MEIFTKSSSISDVLCQGKENILNIAQKLFLKRFTWETKNDIMMLFLGVLLEASCLPLFELITQGFA